MSVQLFEGHLEPNGDHGGLAMPTDGKDTFLPLVDFFNLTRTPGNRAAPQDDVAALLTRTTGSRLSTDLHAAADVTPGARFFFSNKHKQGDRDG